MSREIVILAYSGGLDTSCILKWLIVKNFDVVCYVANIGQDDDFEAVRAKAMKIGAMDVVVDDRREDFIENYVFPAIKMGLIYESRYLMGTSLARPCISDGLVATAKRMNATYISHGATGKGNDQVRLELSAFAIWPEGKVIAPWREKEFFERFTGRDDLMKYAEKNGIPVPVTKKAPWSMDGNILHISYESGILENPWNSPPKDLFHMTKNLDESPNTPAEISVTFHNGTPKSVFIHDENKEYTKPLEIVEVLNKLGGAHTIGRVDIVENRFVGLKSRGVYECPFGTIMYIAHLDLEVFTLDREVLKLKRTLQERMSELVYNGFWFSPEAYFARHCLEHSQDGVTGMVKLQLFKGTVTVLGRKSDVCLYSEKLVSMNEHGGLSPAEATGFINIHAIRLRQFAKYQKTRKESS